MNGTRPSGALDWSVLRQLQGQGAPDELVRRARIGWDGETGTDHLSITAGRDVDVHVTTADGFPLTARLFAPAGVWRLPPIGDECLVLAQGSDWATPGAPVCLWKHRLPPEHISTENAVIEVPSGGLLVGDGAEKAAARTDDPILPGTLSFAASGATLTIIYTPPGGSPTTVTVGLVGATFAPLDPTAITLGGRVGEGSSKVRIE